VAGTGGYGLGRIFKMHRCWNVEEMVRFIGYDGGCVTMRDVPCPSLEPAPISERETERSLTDLPLYGGMGDAFGPLQLTATLVEPEGES
jgi:hypothetical protein